ncbi:MAG: type II toxin-antitoxin system HicA family toxin [Nitrospiraceae bacterium]|nr:type II toxin-antitoxin system HicA family toxin [Nitrospiraceae bacterium]
MTKFPELSHERIVRALKKAGFTILREGKHTLMTDGRHLTVIPRHRVIKTKTLKSILEGADMTLEQFRELL